MIEVVVGDFVVYFGYCFIDSGDEDFWNGIGLWFGCEYWGYDFVGVEFIFEVKFGFVLLS